MSQLSSLSNLLITISVGFCSFPIIIVVVWLFKSSYKIAKIESTASERILCCDAIMYTLSKSKCRYKKSFEYRSNFSLESLDSFDIWAWLFNSDDVSSLIDETSTKFTLFTESDSSFSDAPTSEKDAFFFFESLIRMFSRASCFSTVYPRECIVSAMAETSFWLKVSGRRFLAEV